MSPSAIACLTSTRLIGVRSEHFLRDIFCRYKRTEGSKGEAPFRDYASRCERYHEHKVTEPCVARLVTTT